MRQTEGLLVFFDEEQRNELLKAGQDAGIESFTDALTIPDLAIRTSRVAALSFSETTLDFLSLVTKGKQVVTSKSRVEFSELLDLDEISFNEISFRLKENLHQYFVRSSSGLPGGLVCAVTGSALKLEAIAAAWWGRGLGAFAKP